MRTLSPIRNMSLALCVTLLSTLAPQHSEAQGTAFTYQGRLNDNGAPANGIYDLQFRIYASVRKP